MILLFVDFQEPSATYKASGEVKTDPLLTIHDAIYNSFFNSSLLSGSATCSMHNWLLLKKTDVDRTILVTSVSVNILT